MESQKGISVEKTRALAAYAVDDRVALYLYGRATTLRYKLDESIKFIDAWKSSLVDDIERCHREAKVSAGDVTSERGFTRSAPDPRYGDFSKRVEEIRRYDEDLRELDREIDEYFEDRAERGDFDQSIEGRRRAYAHSIAEALDLDVDVVDDELDSIVVDWEERGRIE